MLFDPFSLIFCYKLAKKPLENTIFVKFLHKVFNTGVQYLMKLTDFGLVVAFGNHVL